MPLVVVLPFHQDHRLKDASFPLPSGVRASLVEPPLPAAEQWQRLVALYDALASETASRITDSGAVTVLTGDCLAVLGTLAGAQRAGLNPSLVWFDGHGDVHTLSTSSTSGSGYLGGMALRMTMGGDGAMLADPFGHPTATRGAGLAR